MDSLSFRLQVSSSLSLWERARVRDEQVSSSLSLWERARVRDEVSEVQDP